MPQLISEIKNAHSKGFFSQLPRGPIGSYVEVPNSQYRDIVETTIGTGLLSAFIVNNTKDRQTLEKILTKFSNNRPVIITNAFRSQVCFILIISFYLILNEALHFVGLQCKPRFC